MMRERVWNFFFTRMDGKGREGKGREGKGRDGLGWIDALDWICRVAWLVAHHITGQASINLILRP